MTIDETINLGSRKQDAGNLAEAETLYRQALALRPNSPEAIYNLGTIMDRTGRWREATDAFRQAAKLRPDFADAHWNLGVSLLRQGDFAAAWPEFQWRWQVPQLGLRRVACPQPEWRGEELNGARILLYGEQGLGDTMHFARYVPLVARRGGRVLLGCQAPLVRLMTRLEGVEMVIPQPGPAPASFNFHCTLPTLPAIFGTTLETIPAPPTYLSADPAAAAAWAPRMPKGGKRRIGLVWAGRPGHKGDAERSLHLGRLAPLAAAKNIHWYSLQKGAAAAQVVGAPLQLVDWTAELNDFADTAALVANLDLVICVDTSVAHLAAAMGKPVWMLVPFVPDWRWMLERSDSPWYPTMRLFRQPAPGDWTGPINRIAEALVTS